MGEWATSPSPKLSAALRVGRELASNTQCSTFNSHLHVQAACARKSKLTRAEDHKRRGSFNARESHCPIFETPSDIDSEIKDGT